MFSIGFNWIVWIFFLPIINAESGVSYNQPIFCPNAKWNSNATTFANDSVFNTHPHGIFINKENNIYVADSGNHKLRVWLKENVNEKQDIDSQNDPYSLFVLNDGYIYFEANDQLIKKQKLGSNNLLTNTELKMNKRCYGLFIDINDTLYCSMKDLNVVMKVSLNDQTKTQNVAADTLNMPHGIFVDTQFNLYVADCGNNRIQRFQSGQINGTTIAGQESIDGKNLNCPTGVILDGNNYLFIVDQQNNRIIRFNSIHFQCVIGCSGVGGNAVNQLNNPYALAFNSKGDMFVVDSYNKRLQKYDLISNSCAISYNQPKFCSLPSWKPEAETIANQSEVSRDPYGIFVSINDSVYAPVFESKTILVWQNETKVPIKTIVEMPSKPTSLFITSDDVIYMDDGMNGQIIKIASNTSTTITLMNVTDHCHGLFVDILNTLYCSVQHCHLLVRKNLDNHSSSSEVIAREGSSLHLPYILHYPRGIFVDQHINIYVADSHHHRVIRLDSKLTHFEVVAGETKVAETIDLKLPSGIVLDADNYLYIVDQGNQRIVGSGPYGFRCLVGCSGIIGSASDQFNIPWMMYFDSKGNMFVIDLNNHRIQKFLRATNSCTLSYNQPKLSSCATWNVNGTTFVNNSITSNYSNGMFVDKNNIVYLTNNYSEYIQIWSQNKTTTTMRNISVETDYHLSLFVTISDDIYVANLNKAQVQKLLPNGTEEHDINTLNAACYGLFIDVNSNLYCSVGNLHKVVKTSLLGTSNNSTLVAGNGTAGFDAHLLHSPYGIFVDVHLTLLVADCFNHRIQRFYLTELNGMTVAGNGSQTNAINLHRPTGIVLDADSNLFIVDHANHRIIKSGPNGSRCIIGCFENGSMSGQLSIPFTMNFDSFGSIYVADSGNNRIQKFDLTTNTCNPNYSGENTTPSQIITVTNPENTIYTLESSTNQESSTTSETSTNTRMILTSEPTTTIVTLTSEPISAVVIITSEPTSTAVMITSEPTTNVVTLTSELTSIPITAMETATTNKISTLQIPVFKPQKCKNSSAIGINCSFPNTICHHLKPCLNNATCTNTRNGYNCTCRSGFNGSDCQHDQRICKQFACFNHGKCNRTFHCVCDPGWQGLHCNTKIDFCAHHRCQNNAVCRSSLRNYTCQCLGNYYYGQYCEKMTTKVLVFKIVSKSFSYIAILAIGVVAIFVLVMDILKYCFGIDPVEEERQRMRKEKATIKQKLNNSRKAINKKTRKQKR